MFEATSLTDKEFRRLSEFIHGEYGIKMPAVKKKFLEGRLQQRLRWLKFDSFANYCDYLFSNEGKAKELPLFVDKITTNKTDFFREPAHFERLTQIILPELVVNPETRKTLMVWSAGCSTGEEPYTLAMVLNEYFEQRPKIRWDFSILATDISSEVLKTAKHAVYEESRIEPVRMEMRRKYLLKSKIKREVRLIPKIRKQVQFKRLNFMERNFKMNGKMDLIFCRNVIIYFDKATQEKLINHFCSYLNKGGYLFLGHSESIQGLEVPLVQVFPTIYSKKP